MVAVQELHPSVEIAAHQMLKTKNAEKRKRKSLWRSSAAESLGRLFEAGSHSSLSFDLQKYLENINLDRNLHFCKKIQAKPLT